MAHLNHEKTVMLVASKYLCAALSRVSLGAQGIVNDA